jgi:general stress protein YciG
MSAAMPTVSHPPSPFFHAESSLEWRAAHDALKANDALWRSLAFGGVQHDGRGGLVEHRGCPHCGTTLSRPISTEQALEVCQHQAVVHALSADAIAEAERVPKKRRRGFASMSPEKQRVIASLGGKVAQQQGRAHRFTTEEARTAGRRGGQTVSANSKHMADIGRRGSESLRAKRRSSTQ